MKAESSSILDMAMGAIKERVDYEMGHVIDNILDPNTNPTKKRKMVLTLELTPDSERRTIQVSCTAKSTLCPTNPVSTSLYVGAAPGTGLAQVMDIYVNGSGNNTITGNTVIRDTGKSSDYTSSQYTIYLSTTSNKNNLIAYNNIMGKDYTSSGGTGNTFVGNKYN